MCCKDYRNKLGQWEKLPEELKAEGVMISHGICPNCLKRVYGRESVVQNNDNAVM